MASERTKLIDMLGWAISAQLWRTVEVVATALMHVDGMAPTADSAEQAQREDAEAIEAAWLAVERTSLALAILPVEG